MELRTYGTRNVFLAQPGAYHEELAATAMTPQQAEDFATAVNRAITGTDFDPIDLALLGAGWHSANEPLTIDNGSYLHEVARMLHRLYVELCEPDGFPGVFGYEIAEPLGKWLAEHDEPPMADAERTAREWITAELERTA
ncbi:hypothetical protein ACUDTL_16925 [Stenotrophomonas pavanii]|uniref:hypothetical protein n=1 Tax=Stenotrophomonas pavanii TaxID=487698 RepID=UPI0040428E59